MAVLVVAIIAIILAWNPDNSILDLVGFAWAGFGAAFGPIILLSLYWRKLTNYGAIGGMITGAITAFIWGKVDALSDALYEIVPGFLVCLIVAVVVSIMTYKPNPEIEEEFNRSEQLLKEERT